ncbi:MAG: 4Fe-4S binding protein [Thermoanaerobaculaceae bacterium]|nr:4Fe-4S binding protein [Thermoanaerobaculaceae bacterium]
MEKRLYLGIPREEIKWNPVIDSEKCTGCQECLNTCPNSVFLFNEDKFKAEVVNPNNCVVLCDKCALFCPSEAITFPEKNEFKKLLRELALKHRKEE